MRFNRMHPINFLLVISFFDETNSVVALRIELSAAGGLCFYDFLYTKPPRYQPNMSNQLSMTG